MGRACRTLNPVLEVSVVPLNGLQVRHHVKFSFQNLFTNIYTYRVEAFYSDRTKTVTELYRQIRDNRVVLVEGHPAIGKTTLLSLLYHYILSLGVDTAEQAPLRLFRFFGWRRDAVQNPGGWREYVLGLTDGALNLGDLNPITDPYLILIDEGQMTYSDYAFWAEYIKLIAQDNRAGPSIHHIILFSSYGSSMSLDSNDHQVIPPFLTSAQRVSLFPHDGLQWQVGLLLTREEFLETLARQTREPGCLVPASGGKGDISKWVAGPEVEEYLFEVTQGHAGGLAALLDAFLNHKV